MATIIGEEKRDDGVLQYGETDPITGQRFESFTPISGQTLQPVPSQNFNTVQESSVYPVGTLDSSPITMTAPEQSAQTLNEEIRKMNEQLLGESAYRTEQEKIQDIAGLTKIQTDLTSQLKALQNEASAIPLQAQEMAKGRGMTAAGLAPLEASRLRQNAIQALSVSSLLEASRGNLATAQDLADRAVAQKFDPIKQELAVKAANLELIIQSPAYSIAEKNRAKKQLEEENRKQKELEKQKEEQSGIQTIAIEAAKMGVDTLTLNRIKNATSIIEATQIAQQTGLFKSVGDEVKSKQAIINLLKDLPYGQTITLDGIEYTSMATNSEQEIVEGLISKYPDAKITTSDTLAQAQAKVPNSRIYQQATRLSGGGGGGNSGSVGEDNERQAILTDIQAIRGSDGYLDTAKYKQIRENVAVNSPKLLSWFDDTYPPYQYLNPNDPSAKNMMQTPSQAGASINAKIINPFE